MSTLLSSTPTWFLSTSATFNRMRLEIKFSPALERLKQDKDNEEYISECYKILLSPDFKQYLEYTGLECTALECAVCTGSIKLCKRILIGMDINTTNSSGETALMSAAEEGYVDICEWLISLGADATIQDNKGETACQKAERYKSPHEIVDLLSGCMQKRVSVKL